MMPFASGSVYIAVATDLSRRFPITMVGRRRGLPTFETGRPVETIDVLNVDGREVAKLEDSDGVSYTASSALPVSIASAPARVASPLLRIRRAARNFFCADGEQSL